MSNEKKIWLASEYSNCSTAQQRDADQLIDQILKDGIKSADIIVDIGCGSGNVTQKLAQRVHHKTIYAADFDPQMVSYAAQNHNDETIRYFVQDFDLPWEKLDDKLKALEGKVDLIFSNRALHWIKDKAAIAKTISRLLKSGGSYYIRATIPRDIFQFSDELKENLENILMIEKHVDQIEKFKIAFRNIGSSCLHFELLQQEWIFALEKQYNDTTSGANPFCRTKVVPSAHLKYSREEIDNAVQTAAEAMVKCFMFPFGKNPYNEVSNNKLHMYYELLSIVGTK